MDRYRLESAAKSIDDYYYPRAHEYNEDEKRQAFDRAKKESIAWTEKYLADVDSLTYDQFCATKKLRRTQDEIATRWSVAMASDLLKLPTDKRDEFINYLFSQIKEHIGRFEERIP